MVVAVDSLKYICRWSIITFLVGFLEFPSSVEGFAHDVCKSSGSCHPLGTRGIFDRRMRKAVALSSESVSSEISLPVAQLDEKQMDFTRGYLNQHHGDLLINFVEAFTEIGVEQAKRNAFSGGSYVIQSAKILFLDLDKLDMEVAVQIRGKAGPTVERVSVPLDAELISSKRRVYNTLSVIPRPSIVNNPVDDMVRRLCRLCWTVRQPAVTGKLIQLALQLGGSGIGALKENLYLNQVPHNRYVRRYFYDLAANATLEAVVLCSQKKISNRMKIVSMFPEMNPSMDSYRIGTLLELTRAIAIRLAEENLRVRVCVQGSMGVGIFTGLPKQLSGVSRLLQLMDWQSSEGESNEGMVGNYVNFGTIGKDQVVNALTNGNNQDDDDDGDVAVVEQDDVFLLVAPQSMVGVETSIFGPLSEMVQAAGDRPVILINPDLTDKISSQGQQSVRGRKERIEFADSFRTVYHFQNIYVSGTSYFPILGAITKLRPQEPWVAHQRRDRVDGGGEIYVPILASEDIPTGDVILQTFDR